MHIVICSSIDFTFEVKQVAHVLVDMGHSVEIPITCKRIIEGELTLDKYLSEKERGGEAIQRKIKDDVIKRYYSKIKNSDAILVLNETKNGIPNYIGGNTFLEMGFAHVLDKTIFVYRDIPEMSYFDELIAMRPVILKGDVSLIPQKTG